MFILLADLPPPPKEVADVAPAVAVIAVVLCLIGIGVWFAWTRRSSPPVAPAEQPVKDRA